MTQSRYLDASGYVRVRVGPNDWPYEHRHVWESANGPIPDGFHVHHRNHDRSDNRPENLELLDGRAHNRHHTAARHASGDLNNRGGRSPRYRLDLNDADIMQRRAEGESFRSIARSYGAAHNVISNHYRRAIAGEGRV